MEENKFKFPTEMVDLPSKGLLYPEGHPLASGQVEMKYMTAREEDILTNQNYIKQGIVIDKLLQSMLITKFDYKDLLIELEVLKDVLNLGMFVGTRRRALTSTEKTTFQNDIATKETEITTQEANIKVIQDDADSFNSEIKSAKQNIEDNKRIVIQHNKDIKDNVRLFKENLIANNAAKVYLEQQPNESDAVFLQRMKNVEQEQFDRLAATRHAVVALELSPWSVEQISNPGHRGPLPRWTARQMEG